MLPSVTGLDKVVTIFTCKVYKHKQDLINCIKEIQSSDGTKSETHYVHYYQSMAENAISALKVTIIRND